jgi:hypothetical protein
MDEGLKIIFKWVVGFGGLNLFFVYFGKINNQCVIVIYRKGLNTPT